MPIRRMVGIGSTSELLEQNFYLRNIVIIKLENRLDHANILDLQSDISNQFVVNYCVIPLDVPFFLFQIQIFVQDGHLCDHFLCAWCVPVSL